MLPTGRPGRPGTLRRNPPTALTRYRSVRTPRPTNGTPGMRIWRVGTKRIFGVLPAEDEIVPEPLKKYVGLMPNLYGDLLACPFTAPRPGEMQMVCIEAASHLVVERYSEGQGQRRVFRVKE